MAWQLGPDSQWQPADANTPLAPLEPHHIHVWWWSLEGSPEEIQQIRRLLTPDELARTDRFVFPELRSRFALAHGRLRQLLSKYLNVAPSAPVFMTGRFGKPSLARWVQTPPLSAGRSLDLRFNLSHSGDHALVAFADGIELGIDLEATRDTRDLPGLARRCFSPAELQVWHALPEDLKITGFFNAWSRKEAFIKAVGEGMHRPLHNFDVSLDPRDPMHLLATRPNADEAKRWQLHALPEIPGFRAALCAERLEPADGHTSALNSTGPLPHIIAYRWV